MARKRNLLIIGLVVAALGALLFIFRLTFAEALLLAEIYQGEPLTIGARYKILTFSYLGALLFLAGIGVGVKALLTE